MSGDELIDTTNPNQGAEDVDAELANDVDATIERLGSMLDWEADEADQEVQIGGMNMKASEVVNMARTPIWFWVGNNTEDAIETAAVLHLATADLLDKHAERDPEEIAAEALDR